MRLRLFITPFLLCAFLIGCGSPEERAAAYLQEAQVFYDEGNFLKAELEAQNAAQIEPRNAQARMLLAELAEKREAYREAIGHLLVAVDADPTLVEAQIKLGDFYFFVGARTPATEQAELARELAPDHLGSLLLNARVSMMNGDRDAAIRTADRLLELAPANVNGIMFKASLFQEPEDRDEAFAILEQGIARVEGKDASQLRQFRAALLRAEGRLEELETELLELIPLMPENDEIENQLVGLYIAQGRIDEAEDVMRDLIAQDPDNERVSRQRMVGFLADQFSIERAEEALIAFIEEAPQSTELRLLLGRYYERFDRTEKARTVYREIVALGPATEDGLAARARIVASDVQLGQVEEARRELASILVDAPDNPEALLFRAGFHYEDGAYDEALADLRVVLRRNSDDERAWLLLARTYRVANEPVLAEDAYRQLLVANPRFSRVAIELAKMVGRRGAIDESIAVLQEALAANPGHEDLAGTMVDILLATGDLERAEAEATRMLELGIDTGQPEYQLARVLRAKGDPDAAIKYFKSALARTPTAIMALQMMAQLLVETERGPEAVVYLEERSAEYPERFDIKFLLGALYANQGATEKAEKIFGEVIAARPEAAKVYENLATLSPDDQKREEIFAMGVDNNPDNARLTLLLGNEYVRSGRFEEALQVYEQFLARNEDNAIAVNNVAAMLLDHRDDVGSHARALELVSRFRNVRHPVLLDTLGWAYYRNDRYLDAVRYLEMAVAGAGQSAIMRYHLGMAYNATENTVGARQELGTALEMVDRDVNQTFTGMDEAREILSELEAAGSG